MPIEEECTVADNRVYGPVPSRRYGLSLGVDLVPHKVCTFDCIYCQVGRTTERTLEATAFYPPEQVLADVERALAEGPRPEVITLAGSGDPSLYAGLTALIGELKRICGLPVVFLTNGALLWRADVRAAALAADVLAPSLDAGDAETFARINRPHPDLDFDRVVAGLRSVCEDHPGQVRLEVMLVAGVNDDDQSVAAIAGIVEGLRLTSIDLNTPVRPAPGRTAGVVSPERLEAIRARLGPRARVIASFKNRPAKAMPGGDAGARERILEVLRRRPCTLADLCASLGLAPEQVAAQIAALRADGLVHARSGEAGEYYFAQEE